MWVWTSLQIDTIWWPDVVPPTKNQITNQTSSGHIRDCHASGRIKQADAISILYAGTPALKGDLTRTGKRTKRGAMIDGANSLQRYYLKNFIDADLLEGMDLRDEESSREPHSYEEE
jgi:hypothetical protein